MISLVCQLILIPYWSKTDEQKPKQRWNPRRWKLNTTVIAQCKLLCSSLLFYINVCCATPCSTEADTVQWRGIAYYESKTYYKCVSVFKLHHTDALLDWKSSMNSLEINPRGLWLNGPNTLFNQHKKQTRFNLICAQLLVIWFYAHSVWKSGDSFYTNVRLLNFSCSQVVLTCSLLLWNYIF